MNLKDQIKALIHLQELDLKIGNLEQRKNSLPAELAKLDVQLADLKKQLDEKTAAYAAVEKVARQSQAASDLNRDRLDRANKKMSDVRNTHEFQAGSREVDQLKKMTTDLDEQKKKNDTDLDAARKAIDEVKAKSEEIVKKKEALAGDLSARSKELDGELTILFSQREKLTPGVRKDILARYDRVRKSKAGYGLVPAVAGRCKGCNMMLSPQSYNELHRANDFQACPSCHRILFIPTSEGGAGAAGSQAAG